MRILHRSYTISHSWYAFHKKVERIQQLLTNNDYHMAFIEKFVQKFLEKKCLQAKSPKLTLTSPLARRIFFKAI